MVVVVAALVGLPDALDPQAVVFERVPPTPLRVANRLFGRLAGGDQAGGHDPVADGGVVAAAVGGHADVGGMAVGVVGYPPVDGVAGVVGTGGHDQRSVVDGG